MVWLSVEHATKPFQFGLPSNLFEVRSEIRALRAAAGHDSLQRTVLPVREAKYMPGFSQHPWFVDVGLQMHRPDDVQATSGVKIVGHAK
jgi:hypothetical protein